MKKVLCLLVLSAGLAGCGTTASQSEVWSHDTLYRDWDHMRFSWGGHKEAGLADVKQSKEDGWWGQPVPVVIPMK